MNFESNGEIFSNDIRSLVNDSNDIGPRQRHFSQNPQNRERNDHNNDNDEVVNRQRADQGNRNNDNSIINGLNGIIPLPIEGIDERDIYTRFTSSELARYMINLLKERIHMLRLIFTLFVLIFTNFTNLLILLPSKSRHEFSFWDLMLNYIIYITPLVQLNWFVLLMLGKNNTKYYISLKFTIIGLTSVTSIIAYFGVLEDDIFQM